MLALIYQHHGSVMGFGVIIAIIRLEITNWTGGSAMFRLVGGDWNHGILFSPIVGMMIQSDELIFFRGVGIPPTSRCLVASNLPE